MLFIAHRGVSERLKDNSVEAINRAIFEDSYDGVEIDLQLCKSGEIVLYHDLFLHDHWIKDLNYDELKLYDIISLEDLYTKIPFIQEKMLILDIKGNDYRIIHKLNEFYKFMDTKYIYFCSFNRPMLNGLERSFKLGRTFECFFDVDELPMILKGVDIVVLHWTCLNEELLNYCRMKDIRVFSYTHKSSMELKYMTKYNVDGVITNGVSPY